ncbi:hypothetical protein ACWCOP_09080 [Maricaulaceae bacterium MS644]
MGEPHLETAMLTLADAVALRALYLAAVLGMGGAGLLTMFTPKLAARRIFYDAVEVNVYLRLLGAFQLSLGLAALIGLARPVEMAAILLVQLAAMALWVAAGAVPAILTGKRETALLFMTILFTVWSLAIVFLFPFAAVFG